MPTISVANISAITGAYRKASFTSGSPSGDTNPQTVAEEQASASEESTPFTDTPIVTYDVRANTKPLTTQPNTTSLIDLIG